MLKCSERCRETQEREPAHTGYSNTTTKNSTIFRDRVITELIYLFISAAMVSMMFRRLIWIHFFYHILWLFVCITSFYLSLTVILTSHFSNITYFRQQQQQKKPMKYYEILPTHTETPQDSGFRRCLFNIITFQICLHIEHIVYLDLGSYQAFSS